MRKLYLAALGMVFATTRLSAQQPVPLSLQQCMDYALQHNYTIKNARVDVKIQQAQVNQQISAAYPHVNVKGEWDRYPDPQQSIINSSSFLTGLPPGTIPTPKGDGESPVAFTLHNGASTSLTATQVLFDGSVFVALKARESVMQFARLNEAVSEETVRYNVFRAYNSLVIAYRQFTIVNNSLSLMRQMDNDVKAMYGAGVNEKLDVQRSAVQIYNLASDSIRTSNILATTEQMLKFQMGMDINTPIILTDTALEQRRENVLSLLTQDSRYEDVPTFNMLRSAVTMQEYNVERYKKAAIPTLNAFGSTGYNYASNHFEKMFFFDKYLFSSAFGLQLNVPVFNGFMRTAQLAEARLNVEKAQNNVDNMKLTIDFQVQQARTSLRNAVLQVQSQRKNMDLSEDVLNLAQKKYKEGVGSNLEVTQAQTDLLRAENNYFSSLLDLVNAEADLKKALGQLK